VTEDNEKRVRDSIQCILITLEARMLLMVREGEVCAIGITDKVVMVLSGKVSQQAIRVAIRH
jgi:hypothetical protein